MRLSFLFQIKEIGLDNDEKTHQLKLAHIEEIRSLQSKHDNQMEGMSHSVVSISLWLLLKLVTTSEWYIVHLFL